LVEKLCFCFGIFAQTYFLLSCFALSLVPVPEQMVLGLLVWDKVGPLHLLCETPLSGGRDNHCRLLSKPGAGIISGKSVLTASFPTRLYCT